MSIAGIASSLFSQISNAQSSRQSSARLEFQQLAQDLQAGNLSQAQADFAALQQNAPASQASGNTSISQAFSSLGQDLQSGNLAAAQQDFAGIQQDFQQAAQRPHHHHHHPSQGSGSPQTNAIAQLFSTLGQDLQSGNLASAQQAYSALQQDVQTFTANGSAPAPAGIQVSA